MFKSWDLGKFAGIRVRIHWTFSWVLLLYTVFAVFSGGVTEAALTATGIILLFACVLAHEFGHAFAARAYGIPTHDITLLPIGGLARLARLPEKPIQELVIALAGPAVNVVIAGVLIALLPVQSLMALSENPTIVLSGHLLENLVFANVVLVLFNLLPAFPMDGGRVLRSLLAMRVGHLRATEIAARVGRWMALAFIIVGLFWHIELCLVGLFVLLSGTGELFDARRRAMPNVQPWFQYAWTSSGPSGTRYYTNYSTQPAAGNSDIIDAVEVKQVYPGLNSSRKNLTEN